MHARPLPTRTTTRHSSTYPHNSTTSHLCILCFPAKTFACNPTHLPPPKWHSLAALFSVQNSLNELLTSPFIDLEAKTETGKDTALLLAAMNGHADAVNSLLKAGAKVSATNKHRRTAAHLAAEEGRLNVLEALVKDGEVDLHARDEYGSTPLIMAAERGHEEVVQFLIQNFTQDPEMRKKINEEIVEAISVALRPELGSNIRAFWFHSVKFPKVPSTRARSSRASGSGT